MGGEHDAAPPGMRLPKELLARVRSAAESEGVSLSAWVERTVMLALREHEQSTADLTQEPEAGGVWQGIASSAPVGAPDRMGRGMPPDLGAVDDEDRARAVIAALDAQAAACTQSPPAPDSRGWGVPDWRDPAAYPAADELSMQEGRWEFLRRRPAYRRDWLRAPEEFGPCPRQRYFGKIYEVFVPVDPRWSISELPTVWRQARGQGTESPSKPRLSERAPFLETLLSRRTAKLRGRCHIVREPPNPAILYMWLSFYQLTNVQWAELRRLLDGYLERFYGWHVEQFHNEAPGAVRRRQGLWPLYLRLLDATDAGASRREMAAVLPGHVARTKQGARDALRAAKKLRCQWPY
jgi:hypothetical protein